MTVHQAARLQLERIAGEFASWRATPEADRSPAPAWWWGPAIAALHEPEAMPAELCAGFELPVGSSYGDAADLLMQALAEQTALPLPDEFPRKFQADPAR